MTDDVRGDGRVHRWCVFDLALTCGHLVTVAVDGWYPVSVACCNRLGGTILRGLYQPYQAQVEYVIVVAERHEHRFSSGPPDVLRLLRRRERTDEPRTFRWLAPSPGRYPHRVGAAWSIDGSTATNTGTRPTPASTVDSVD